MSARLYHNQRWTEEDDQLLRSMSDNGKRAYFDDCEAQATHGAYQGTRCGPGNRDSRAQTSERGEDTGDLLDMCLPG
jgi:hypothetical protein